MLHSEAASEVAGSIALDTDDAGTARADWEDTLDHAVEYRIRECRDHRVPDGSGPEALLHRDEYAHPGGAPGDGDGDRCGPGEEPNSDCRGSADGRSAARSNRASRSRD